MKEKVNVIQLAKFGTNRSLTDFQFASWKDSKGKEIHKIKVTIVEYEDLNGKKKSKGNAVFYLDFDEAHLLAEDILHCRFNLWNVYQEKKQMSLYRGTEKEAREFQITFQKNSQGKNQFVFQIQSSKETIKKGGIYGINKQKAGEINKRLNYADFHEVRKAMLSLSEFIKAWGVQALQSKNFNLRWNVIQYEKTKRED